METAKEGGLGDPFRRDTEDYPDNPAAFQESGNPMLDRIALRAGVRWNFDPDETPGFIWTGPTRGQLDMVPRSACETPAAYCYLLAHELSHSTTGTKVRPEVQTPDHAHRRALAMIGLDDDWTADDERRFRQDYAREELIAELSGALVLDAVGESAIAMKRCPVYLRGWLTQFPPEERPAELERARAPAEASANYLLSLATNPVD